MPLRVVADRNRGGAYLATLLTGAGLFAMFVFLSYYFQQVLSYSALKAGLAFLPFAAGVILAAGASTALVPRLGPRVPMSVGIFIGALGLAWLTQIGVHTSYWTSCSHRDIDERRARAGLPGLEQHGPDPGQRAGLGSGERAVNTAQQVGGSLGTALLNTIAATATATYIAAHGPTFNQAGTVHGFAVAFGVGACLLLLASAVSAIFINASPSDVSNLEAAPAPTNG